MTIPDPERKRDRSAEVEAMIAEQDERSRDQDHEHAGRTQLALLRARLLSLGIDVPEEAKGNWWTDEESGELRAWWLIDGAAYYEQGDVIYVEREAHGATEWTTLDADGWPVEPWQRTVPPRDLAEFN